MRLSALRRGVAGTAVRYATRFVMLSASSKRRTSDVLFWEPAHFVMERKVMCRLWNGASLVALRDGRPADTTMGLTPIGGVIMGTRTGDLDPGVLLYLMREQGYDAGRLGTLLNEESGLLGISDLTPDMKTLLERRDSDPRAADAVHMFCDSVRNTWARLRRFSAGSIRSCSPGPSVSGPRRRQTSAVLGRRSP